MSHDSRLGRLAGIGFHSPDGFDPVERRMMRFGGGERFITVFKRAMPSRAG